MIDSHGSLAASDSEDDFNLDSATSSSDSEDDSNSDSATSEKSQNGKGNLTSQKRHVHQSTSKIQHFISKQYEDSAANTNIELTGKMKNDLLQKIDGMEVELPANTLDALIHKLGGSGQVAEMTGRKVDLYNVHLVIVYLVLHYKGTHNHSDRWFCALRNKNRNRYFSRNDQHKGKRTIYGRHKSNGVQDI